MNKSLDEVISDRQVELQSALSTCLPQLSTQIRQFSNTATMFRVETIVDAETAAVMTGRETVDWVHDKFDDDQPDPKGSRVPNFRSRNRPSPELESNPTGAKIRIDNLHYELGREDLEDLFSRKGPLLKVDIRYDRAGRSEGVAFITYEAIGDARAAIRDYDGANANGQPIRLTLVSNPTPPARPRNPFDTAQKPSRSLFDRITGPATTRSRSYSPDRSSIRHSDVSKPPPGHIDRYVPGQRTRSPMPPRRGGGGGRRPGARRDERERGSGRLGKDGRPRKTQEELDAEMEDYFGSKGDDEASAATDNGVVATAVADGDVEMIE
ncbi:MAG: hypothetical protein M1840_000336 [Geoglossum simile]|nr:MAG: hypothetical protein M1840_000336 [Geoglossum simile]